MRLQINLRRDLAKLNDGELARRLGEAWRAYEVSTANARFKVWASWRGPLRHRWAYRLTSFAEIRGPGFTGSLGAGPFFHRDAMGTHLIVCEIRDLYDEIQRRVDTKRRLSNSAT
jgi:hypothetical protein